MRLQRMGCFHQTRLSFMRVLLRRLKREKWSFQRMRWEINAEGYGRAVYTVRGLQHDYSLVAFSTPLTDEQRSDRVIATAWDTSFAVYDGIPDASELDRLQENVPKQEAGRVSDRELSLSRANRSVRLWDHVVDRLSRGLQPEREQLEAVGYLLRTTAVYGSGKVGAADRLSISDRPELRGPFQVEMLSVWLTRAFSIDLVEHIARAQGGDNAVNIDTTLRRRIGVGNSTGLGMAPFLINHPVLLNNWMFAREEAFARVRALEKATGHELERFLQKLQSNELNVSQWNTQHLIQLYKLEGLRRDVDKIRQYSSTENLFDDFPWNRFYCWAEQNLTMEGQELLLSMMLEPYAELVDDLAEGMDAEEQHGFVIDGAVTTGDLSAEIEANCDWAINVDFQQAANRARFWYTSAEKLEPRLGERFDEPGAEYELPLCSGLYINQLYQALADQEHGMLLADYLLQHPEHRHAVRRVQILQSHPYAEIQDNLIADDMLPIDLLRCKLSFFGATKFDPRSDRWIRICMYQDAPFPHELLSVLP